MTSTDTSTQASRFELCPNKWIGNGEPCFVIAEVGQNHQGDVGLAMELIKTAKRAGADCVKFQKSTLEAKFNRRALERRYDSIHAFGVTYGDHKRTLELSQESFHALQRFAANEDIEFTASAMDSKSLDFLLALNVPFIKIGSGDGNNFPLIRRVAMSLKPLVLSTGMQDQIVVDEAVKVIRDIQPELRLALLHCVSAYPTPLHQINLKVIKTYQDRYEDAVIGYSGHEEGIQVSLAAVALGASVLERHLTLNKTMKGNDHRCSLELDEFISLVAGVRTIETALGNGIKRRQSSELPCHRKLGKSIVASMDISMGTILGAQHLDIKVAEPAGIQAEHFHTLLGHRTSCFIAADESLCAAHLHDYNDN